ncbi:MAG TPA: response regulator transcription factor [Candidatus Fraserbacteria bacterium]|nr:response regulator transcription factor [Candidatus Fraserbacteria bacterium]
MRLLIAEDDADARELLKVYLEAKGHQVVMANDGVEALEKFKSTCPEVVLLDIMLPRLDGWSVLEAIRVQSHVPVIFLTALDSTDDVIKGLSLGGDDYLTKPFEPRELEARIQAVLRRVSAKIDLHGIQVGTLSIDDRAKVVTLEGKPVQLSPKEYELLRLLAIEPGRVFSDAELIIRLWPQGSRATSNDVKQYIHLLRNKIEEEPQHPRWIQTVKGFGYKLAG